MTNELTNELKESTLSALCKLIMIKWHSTDDTIELRSYELLIDSIIDAYYDENEDMLYTILDELNYLSIV